MHKTNKKSLKSREAIVFYILISPFILYFVLLRIIPMAYALYLSFTNLTGFNWDNVRFTGIKNYARILQDSDVVYSAGRTFCIALIFIPLQLIIVNLIALLLSRDLRGVGFFRTIYYIPSIVPAVAGGMMWMQLYNKNSGFFNQILGYFGITVNWLGYEWVTPSLIFMMLWSLGAGLLVTLAAIKQVPAELYESAEIDGARPFTRYMKITLPIVSPVNLYNLLMGIIWTLQIYAQPILLTPPGVGESAMGGVLGVPLKPNYLYMIHIYQEIFAKQRFGYGLSLIWLLFIVITGLTLVALKTSNGWVHYEVEQEEGKER